VSRGEDSAREAILRYLSHLISEGATKRGTGRATSPCGNEPTVSCLRVPSSGASGMCDLSSYILICVNGDLQPHSLQGLLRFLWGGSNSQLERFPNSDHPSATVHQSRWRLTMLKTDGEYLGEISAGRRYIDGPQSCFYCSWRLSRDLLLCLTREKRRRNLR